MVESTWDRLIQNVREISDLRMVKALMDWDMETYMPPAGNDARARQLALVAEIAHKRLCDPALGDLLLQCAADSGATAEQKAILREVRRERDRAVKVPAALVREIAETTSKAVQVWAGARTKNHFSEFAPWLEKIVELKKQEAHAVGIPAGGVEYDALIDEFEPGATVAELNRVIEQTREITVAALRAIKSSKRKSPVQILERNYPEKEQEELALETVKRMGYDFNAGRLDRSVHPFCTSFDVRDVRITTRFDEKWLPAALFGCVHEAGHALYEQGFDPANAGTPLATAISMGIHESQSRIWENQIGRSLSFWKYLYPKARKAFPKALKGVDVAKFHFAINAVRPSFIRVEADEVTYNLHIVIRYELEQALFKGELAVKDLPAAWNKKMKDYLGIAPKKDSDGVLQDIHWAIGAFGYFPTYLLGNLYAAQWMATLRKQMPDLDRRLARGDWLSVRKWLGEKIHRHGRLHTAASLVREVSGEPLNPKYLDEYFKAKFGPLYDVKW